MKKFIFKMQRVLDIKMKKEDILKQELSKFFFKKSQHEEARNYYLDKMDNEFSNIRNKPTFTSSDREIEINYLSGLKTEIYKQKLIITDYENKIDKKRNELLENKKEIMILEKLKEKQKETFMYELALQERKEMDEVASRQRYSFAE
jgi:flagellar protein FliJ